MQVALAQQDEADRAKVSLYAVTTDGAENPKDENQSAMG